MDKDVNLLIFSDVHIGDRRTMERNRDLRASQADELRPLLDHYRENRVEGRPWRLIIAGDFVDFVEVTELPDEAELVRAGIQLDRDRKKYGLHSGPWESAWKLGRIMSDNGEVFAALARFVEDGNHLFIISGNHDASWYWPEVREKLLGGLAAIIGADGGGDPAEVLDSIRERIHFNPWFYYEQGDLWVEHGFQFDPYNSVEYVLAPLYPRKNEMAPTIGNMAQRYLTNRVTNINPYAENTTGFFDYFIWVFRTHGFSAFRIIWYYLESAARLVGLSGRLRRRRLYVQQLKAEYRLQRITGISRRAFRRMRRMHRRPVLRSWRLTMAYVHLDKMLLMLVYIGVTIYLLWLPLTMIETLVAVLVLATSLYGVVQLISLGRKRLTREKYFKTGARVAKIVGVNNVVMGHMHEPFMGSIGASVRVFGLGAWISNQGGIDPGLVNAVIPSYVVATGPAGKRRIIMYTWDRESKSPRDGRLLSRMEILAA